MISKACKGFAFISKACKGFALKSKACKGFTFKSDAFKGFTLIRTRLCRNLVNVQAFTLIEMLVVISIIGILATIVLSNMSGVRERARDVQRKSDISQIQKAMEMYKNAQTVPAYPVSGITNLKTALENGGVYMQKMSYDPYCPGNVCTSNWVNYSYTRGADVLTYTLTTCLENASDPQADSPLVNCSNDSPKKGALFTRSNP